MKFDSVLVCVCTYNEEKNISDCIDAIRENGYNDILIVDASTDRTKEIADNKGVLVKVCEKGLARQRQVAIDYCDKEYLVFVDADDRIKNDCIDTLISEMNEDKYDAIGAQVRVFEPTSYWQKAIDATWQYSMFKKGPSNMVGRPAVYRTAAIKDAGSDLDFVNIGNEDTAISIRMEQKGYRQGIGTGISYRICHASFEDNKREWIKYGKGDAQVIAKYPHKRKKIIMHDLWEYPIARSADLIKNGKIKYCLYPICIGIYRYRTLKKVQKNKI